MSTEASPQQPTHLGQTYAQAAMSVGTAPNGGQPPAHLLGPDSGNRSYADSDTAASAPESPAVPPTKGKNGATGPAEGKPKPHVCPICQRGFTTGGHLQRHQRIHTGIKAFKCPYPGCETRTSRQDNLQQHYRTHLSPTLRRGSGTAARQAVAAAMMAAGLKSSTSRQPRKSKGSQVGTPGSSSGASGVHGQSPYQTPTQGTAPYGGYMYDPNQHGYPSYPPTMPPGVGGMAQPQSAQSSRVPSPVNGHSSQGGGGVPSAHHQQYFSQPFSPAYAYPNSSYGQPYRYGQPGAVPSPYGPPSHHSIYSQGIAPEHGGQQHMYSPLQTGFAPHSRDSQYNVINPSGYASQAPMGNGYPPRTQTSTPLSNGTHEEVDPRYRGAAAPPRAPSPRRRLTPPHQAEMLASAGVVDTANLSTTAGHQAASRAPLSAAVPPQYSYNAAAPSQQTNGYAYGAHHQSLGGRTAVTNMGGVVGGPDTKAFIKHE